MNRKAPYILLLVLFVILTFILGVRYGQRVEKTNKTVSYLLSIAPTKPAPTETPLRFKIYKNKFCSIEFTYPEVLKVVNETTSSARFIKGEKKVIEFDCTATTSAIFKNKKISPLNSKTIYYEVAGDLLPLFESSLKFSLR